MAITGIVAVTPALPYIAKDLLVQPDKIGLVVSLFALPGIIFTPVYGVLSDKYGRKNILVPSLIIFGIFGTLGFFINDFYWLLVFRFISGIGAASLGALNVVLIGDLFKDERRQKIVGYNNSALNFGTTIVPIIGGALAKIHWNYVFLLPSLAVLLALWMIFKFEEPIKPKTEKVNYFKGFIESIKNYKLTIIFVVNILTYIILFGSLWTYIPFLIEKKFLSSSLINGLVLSGMSLMASISSIFFGKISNKFGHKNIFIFAFTLKAAALLSVIFVSEWYYLFGSMALFGIGFGLNLPNIQTLVIKLSPENHRGVLVSLNRTLSLLGQFLGPIISGFILFIYSGDLKGINTIFIAFSIVSVLTLGVSITAFFKKQQI